MAKRSRPWSPNGSPVPSTPECGQRGDREIAVEPAALGSRDRVRVDAGVNAKVCAHWLWAFGAFADDAAGRARKGEGARFRSDDGWVSEDVFDRSPRPGVTLDSAGDVGLP